MSAVAVGRIRLRMEVFEEAAQEVAIKAAGCHLAVIAAMAKEAAARDDVDLVYGIIQSIRETLDDAERELDDAFGE